MSFNDLLQSIFWRSAILRNIRTWVFRLAFAAFLGAVGWGTYHWARTRPRCVIETDSHILHFSEDGSTIVTGFTTVRFGQMTQSGGEAKTPLKVWNTHTGELVRRVLEGAGAFKRYGVCKATNLIAIDTDREKVRVANWQTGEEWDIDVGPGEIESWHFSPHGDFLAIRLATKAKGEAATEAIIGMQERRVIKRFQPGARLGWPWVSGDGSRCYFSAKDRMYAWNVKTSEVEGDWPQGQFLEEGRFFVHQAAEDLSVVVCDGTRMAEITRIHPVLPPDQRSDRSDFNADDRERIMRCRHFVLAPGGRRIATYAEPWDRLDGALEIWEIPSGRRLAAFPDLKRGWTWFLDDKRLVFFDQSHVPHEPIERANYLNSGKVAEITTMIDVDAAKIRWRHPTSIGKTFFLREDTAVELTPEGNWEIFHPMTEETRRAFRHPFTYDRTMVSLSSDKRLVRAYGQLREHSVPDAWRKWLGRWVNVQSDRVQILDTVNDRIILDLAIDAGCGAELSEDGQTLLVQDMGDLAFGRGRKSKNGLIQFRFYDVHNPWPWIWAFLAPTGVAGFAWGWRTWRRKSSRTKKNADAFLSPLNGGAGRSGKGGGREPGGASIS